MEKPFILEAIRHLGTAPFRIEWFGDIAYAGQRGGRSPLVKVVLSPNPGRSTSIPRSYVEVSIPASYLRLIRIGDIWALGQRIGPSTGSMSLSLQNLLIDNTTTDTVPAGVPDDGGDSHSSYLLPFSKFDAHRSHTGSFCVRVRVQDGTILVIPCMELIRFYFGSSGLLLNRLFSGAFATQNLYETAWCRRITGVANVTLASGIPYPAATTVARIALDDHAAKAASWIANSGVASIANGERYYPKTKFPFEGKTDLVVQGRWLNTESRHVFLVERLVQCSHPFPFNKLFVRSSAAISEEQRTRRQHKSKCNVPGSSANRADQIALLEGYVARARIPIALDDDLDEPFPDLAGKPICRLRETTGLRTSTTSVQISNLMAGAQSSSLGGRSAEITSSGTSPNDRKEEPKSVITFQAAFHLLQQNYQTAASMCPILSSDTVKGTASFQRSDWIVPVPNEKHREVWCTKIAFPVQSRKPLLALLRITPPSASSTCLTLLRISNSTDQEKIALNIVDIFANGHQQFLGLGIVVGELRGTDTHNLAKLLKLLEGLLCS